MKFSLEKLPRHRDVYYTSRPKEKVLQQKEVKGRKSNKMAKAQKGKETEGRRLNLGRPNITSILLVCIADSFERYPEQEMRLGSAKSKLRKLAFAAHLRFSFKS